MTLRLNGSTSGYVEIDAPATAGSNTLVLPNGNGTNGQYLKTNGSGSLSWATLPAAGYTFLAAGTVSGNSSVTVTGIPSTAQQIIIPFRSISNNDANGRKMKLNVGNGSIDTGSNYTYSVFADLAGINSTSSGTYYLVTQSAFTSAANVFDGMIWITRIGTNEWAIVSTAGETANNNAPSTGGGRYFGANTIDRVQISCDTGSFDSGEFRVGYL